jgi:transposase
MNNAFIGIDVSKGYMDACLMEQQGKVVKQFEKFYDTRSHHDLFIKNIEELLKQGYSNIYCGLESTGGYENNWTRTISENSLNGKVSVFRINPKRIHHESRTNMTRTVSDPVSAFTIADHLRKNLNQFKDNPVLSTEMYNARKCYKFICLLQKQKNQVSNHLEKVIYENLPELARWCKSGVPKWMIELLKQYPGKERISKARVTTMAKIKGLTSSKAELIKTKIADGIGATEDQYSSHLIKSLVIELASIDSKIVSEKAYLIQNYQDKNIDLLRSIPGIGIQSAVTLLIEIEDYTRFKDASSMAVYFGLNPVFRASGDKSGKTKMSKAGRASFRHIMYNVARNSVMHSEYFKSIYTKHRGHGMHHNQAIGVIMHKVTRIVFGILKSQKSFDKQTDLKNIEKSTPKRKELNQAALIIKTEKKILEIAQSAPCSARYLKKEKAKLQSQDHNMTKNEITETQPLQI